MLLEINNSWYLQGPRRFESFDAINKYIFAENPIHPQIWVPFSPGACYVLPRENILNAPKEIYAFLSYISSYKFFPIEAHAVERILYTIFTTSQRFNSRFYDAGLWSQDLPKEREFPPSRKFFSRLYKKTFNLNYAKLIYRIDI